MSSYKKMQKLGSGAFATTFLVEEIGKGAGTRRSGKQLVMKRVPCKHMRAANAALQEVKVLLSCHHDGIVGYHDFFLDTDSDENIVICLVMEYCDAGDLWEKIANARRSHAPLPPAQVAGYTLQLVAALRYLHARSILHRDIKPENVFLTEEGMVAKLGDFGLATATEDVEHGGAKTQVGTPDYMAPEVLEGKSYSAPADVFSLGATVYAMVCASFPKMLAMHLGQGKPLDWSAAAEAMPLWKSVVAKMLEVDADKRPSLDEVGQITAALPEAAGLQGVSLAAKVAATRPVPIEGQPATLVAAPSAAAPAAPPPPIASRPSQPCPTDVRSEQLVLLWEPPAVEDIVDAYQVLAQTSGSGGFRALIESTRSSQPIVHLSKLTERTWYEFKVVALNAAGSSPASLASQPVQTAAAPPSPAVKAAQEAAAAAAAAIAAELHMKSPRLTDTENLLVEREDPELLVRYAQCKRELLAWEAKFERHHARPASEADKVADVTYQGLMARYKRLKHAKRKLIRGSETHHPSMSDLSSSSGQPSSPPHSSSPVSVTPASTSEALASGSAAASYYSRGASSNAVSPPGSLSQLYLGTPTAPAGAPQRPPAVPTPTSQLAVDVSRASPPPERPSGRASGSPHSKGKKSKSKRHLASGSPAARRPQPEAHAAANADVRSHTHASQPGSCGDLRSHTMMTVAMKASHPSPRALGYGEETFE